MPPVGSRRKGSFVKWNVTVPADLAYRFEALYLDTGKRKPIYGSKAQIIEQLLEEYVRQIEEQQGARAYAE
jgi:predicted TIM-barrel fold metal-dependent hydrolase